jgi:hypothetical protein
MFALVTAIALHPAAGQQTGERDFVKLVLDSKDSALDVKPHLESIDGWINEDPSAAFDAFLPFAKEGNMNAITFIRRITENHLDNKNVAQSGARFFVEHHGGLSLETDYRASTGIFLFRADDFTTTTKQMIHGMLHGPRTSGKAVFACGIAQMKEEIPFLKSIMRDSKDEGDVFSEVKMLPIAWQAKLACARMGERSDIEEVIEIVKGISPQRRLVSRLRDLGYIRQPEAIQYLQGILFSDEQLPMDRDVLPGFEAPPPLGIPYARYAIHVLTACLEGFPNEWDAGRYYSDDEIQKARRWMLEHRDWKIIR